MTEAERAALDLASRALDYPDDAFFAGLEDLRRDAMNNLSPESPQRLAMLSFIETMQRQGSHAAQQTYVATFDHDPDASLYLAWHRYGNDRGQGKALAALNGLYRAAGLEPIFGSMPDYLPRMLEFMAIADEWAIAVLLDGFGPEIAGILEHLKATNSVHEQLLTAAIDPMRSYWPELFKPRNTPDPTLRPMAKPEPETILQSLDPMRPEE